VPAQYLPVWTLSGFTTNGGLLYTNAQGRCSKQVQVRVYGITRWSHAKLLDNWLLGSEVSGLFTVGNGGTGVNSFTTNGCSLWWSTLGSTAAGTNGQIFVGNTSSSPGFVTLLVIATLNSGPEFCR